MTYEAKADYFFEQVETRHNRMGFVCQSHLKKQFEISVNGTPVAYQFLGKEISEDMMAVWCYLYIPEVRTLKELSVSNKILMEVYDDQKNIVSVVGPGERKGLLLFQRGKYTDSVSF